jgi:hypothetical protein
MPDPRSGAGARSYAVQQRLSAGSAKRQLLAARRLRGPIVSNRRFRKAPLFAEAVHRIHVGESISSLFSDEPTYG